MRYERLYKAGKSSATAEPRGIAHTEAKPAPPCPQNTLRTHSSWWGWAFEPEIPCPCLTAFSRCSWSRLSLCDPTQGHVIATQPHYTVQKSIAFLCFEAAAHQFHCMLPALLLENTAILIPQGSPPWQSQTPITSLTAAPFQPEEFYFSSSFHCQKSFFALITLVALVHTSSSQTVSF